MWQSALKRVRVKPVLSLSILALMTLLILKCTLLTYAQSAGHRARFAEHRRSYLQVVTRTLTMPPVGKRRAPFIYVTLTISYVSPDNPSLIPCPFPCGIELVV
ncbi:hypothetical protein BC628DRAFT_1363867 [Trametes gibbosa]|nr:hypothetical protein BC628DRAFT_1363867 [Trametes gibbosa]